MWLRAMTASMVSALASVRHILRTAMTSHATSCSNRLLWLKMSMMMTRRPLRTDSMQLHTGLITIKREPEPWTQRNLNLQTVQAPLPFGLEHKVNSSGDGCQQAFGAFRGGWANAGEDLQHHLRARLGERQTAASAAEVVFTGSSDDLQCLTVNSKNTR